MSSIGRLMAILAVSFLGGTPLVAQVSQSPSTSARFEETHVATPDGVRLYVRVLGDGPDTVVIGSVAYLAQDLAPLQSGRTLIFYDPRSRGGSDAVLDPTRSGMDYEVDDIEAIRTHFRIESFSIIGWSYLGAVVALYAARHPERVQAVIQIGPMPPRASTFQNARRVVSAPDSADVAYLAQLRREGVPASDPVRYCREYVLRLMLRPMMGRRDAAAKSKADPCTYWNEWPDQVFATLRRLLPQVTGENWDYSPDARRVGAPVLVIHGTVDPNAPIEGGRDWAGLLPNARLLELPGIGHGPWVEAPGEFFSAVDGFLRANARRR